MNGSPGQLFFHLMPNGCHFASQDLLKRHSLLVGLSCIYVHRYWASLVNSTAEGAISNFVFLATLLLCSLLAHTYTCTHTHTHTCTNTCTYTHTNTCTYTHTNTCTYTYKHMYTHTNTCTYTHTNTYTRACTHKHTHTKDHSIILLITITTQYCCVALISGRKAHTVSHSHFLIPDTCHDNRNQDKYFLKQHVIRLHTRTHMTLNKQLH